LDIKSNRIILNLNKKYQTKSNQIRKKYFFLPHSSKSNQTVLNPNRKKQISNQINLIEKNYQTKSNEIKKYKLNTLDIVVPRPILLTSTLVFFASLHQIKIRYQIKSNYSKFE